MPAGGERKTAYIKRLTNLFDTYQCCLVSACDFVGAAHLQSIRKALRQYNAVMLMGKNTMVRKALRNHAESNPNVDAIVSHVRGNIGFIFCQRDDLKEVVQLVKENRVGAPAKSGVVAPCDVTIPAGPTGLEPTQTSFLQALNIGTKIVRSQIEILQDVHIIKEGVKVGSSEAALLQKLNIKPFTYGLELKVVYDEGSVYSAKVLDITDDDLTAKFLNGVRKIAAISLKIGFPTVAALPHVVANGYKKLVAISLATDYTFDKVAELKALLDDPEALAKAQAAAASSGGGGAAAADAKKEEAKPESESEEEEEMDFDLFG